MNDGRDYKRLVRIKPGRWIAGVCAGFGAYFNVDPTLIRLLWVLTLFLGGAGLVMYLVAWVIMPLDASD